MTSTPPDRTQAHQSTTDRSRHKDEQVHAGQPDAFLPQQPAENEPKQERVEDSVEDLESEDWTQEVIGWMWQIMRTGGNEWDVYIMTGKPVEAIRIQWLSEQQAAQKN